MIDEKLNEEAARNNNLDSATIRTGVDISDKKRKRDQKTAAKNGKGTHRY